MYDGTKFTGVLVPGIVVTAIFFLLWLAAANFFSNFPISPPSVLLTLLRALPGALVVGSVVGLILLAQSDKKRMRRRRAGGTDGAVDHHR